MIISSVQNIPAPHSPSVPTCKIWNAYYVKRILNMVPRHGCQLRIGKRTVLALASRDSTPADFNRPGHILPLKYREGGVLKRAGHREASIDLTILAGLDPVAVLCEVVDDDGSMARLPSLASLQNRKI